MECRKLEITLVSADNLPDVRSLGLMKVFAKVSLKGESKTSKKSPVDAQGETNPRWNFPVEYTISESTVQQPGVNLAIKLFCKRTLGDRFIGEVNIPVKSLFDMGIKAEKIMSYAVAGTPNGRLNILYSFGEKIWVPKPSGWRKALGVGFLVLVEGAQILLSGESEDDDDDESDEPKHWQESKDVPVDQTDPDEVFYDAR
ncbi:hypothetical protein Pfo_021133 [Paulownia fortunei]|nr:hypothetical protein Pfo_021133 [Paulownia fortunei]